MVGHDLSDWTVCELPQKRVLHGRLVRLEPLSANAHGDELFLACVRDDAAERFRYLPEYPPQNREDFQPWLEMAQNSSDPLYFAVVDQKTGQTEGRQTLMRHDPKNGVIEIGHIYWGSRISQTPATTEALFLFAQYIFDELGYRRFEWKCNNANEPSKRAALRFGFSPEGVFRQAAVTKGKNRDTAWFSLLDCEWKTVKLAFQSWLDPANFGPDGQQKTKLGEFMGCNHG